MYLQQAFPLPAYWKAPWSIREYLSSLGKVTSAFLIGVGAAVFHPIAEALFLALGTEATALALP